jgi:histidinol-phosphate aminotransferase
MKKKIAQLMDLVRPGIKELKSYHLAPEPASVKLNQNESPFDLPQRIKDRVLCRCRERAWNRYPPFIPDTLKGKIARYCGTSADSIIVGNGSNEMLLVCLLSILDIRTPVIVCPPCFTVYALLVHGLGGSTHPVYLTDELAFDIDGIRAGMTQYPRAPVILASPNNPTGSALTKDDLECLLASHDGFVILDQAYVEFGGYDAIELIATYPNLIVTRTFSKAYGAAGLRLGYMVADPQVARQVNKIKLPYNINFFSLYVAEELLDEHELLHRRLDETVAERERMYAALRNYPFDECYNTHANFLLLRCGDKESFFEYVKKQGVLLRDVSAYPMLQGCVRLTIGSEEENEYVRSCIDSFFNGKKA